MVKEGLNLSKILKRENFENAIRVNAAIGGSTNAVIHLKAIAGRIGVDLELEDWTRVGRGTPRERATTARQSDPTRRRPRDSEPGVKSWPRCRIATNAEAQNTSVQATAASLANGASATVTVVVSLTNTGSATLSYTNTATGTSTTPDPTPGNNTGTSTVTIETISGASCRLIAPKSS